MQARPDSGPNPADGCAPLVIEKGKVFRCQKRKAPRNSKYFPKKSNKMYQTKESRQSGALRGQNVRKYLVRMLQEMGSGHL